MFSVIFSHSSAYDIHCPHGRNVPNDVLKRMVRFCVLWKQGSSVLVSTSDVPSADQMVGGSRPVGLWIMLYCLSQLKCINKHLDKMLVDK